MTSVRVLVASESWVIRERLQRLLENCPDLVLAGVAADGAQAVDLLVASRPAVVALSPALPPVDGAEVIRRIMERCALPIVVIDSRDSRGGDPEVFRCLDAGAVASVKVGSGDSWSSHVSTELLRVLRSMSEVKVVGRHTPRHADTLPVSQGAALGGLEKHLDVQLIAVGSSTGGPLALRTILSALPATFPLPVAVVQHIAPGFIQGMVQWISEQVQLQVVLGEDGMELRPGRVHFAPDGLHMLAAGGGRMALRAGPPENGEQPAVTALYRSVVKHYGHRSLGILLTGMGRDGAAELKRMRDAGAITVAQDEASSVVHGMPGEAIRIGAATYVLNPDRIAQLLAALVSDSIPERSRSTDSTHGGSPGRWRP